MSDFSGLEQSFALPGISAAVPFDDVSYAAALSDDVQPHEVSFRRLKGAEISQVLHLRNEIALPPSALADAGFITREKKEIR